MSQESVKAEHINAFVVPFLETLENMAGIRGSAKGVTLREGAGASASAAVGITISGRLNGDVFIVFEDRTALKVASLMMKRLLGTDVSLDAVTPEAEGALKELANVTLGRAVGKLKDLGLESTTISPPTIHTSEEDVACVMTGKSFVAIPFVMGNLGRVELAMRLTIAPRVVEGANSKKVLVVDDSVFQRDVLKMLLQNHGYAVVGEAGDGEEAVRLFKELQPDVVTLDIIMPGMDGVDTLQKLKEISPAARVIMVSSISDKDRIVECRRLGAEYYILKPFDPEKVLEVLQKC